MATKLYPPNIEGTIPAFSGTTMVVPFSLNRAVSKNEIAGFVVKIKTVQGSTLIGTIRQQNADYYDLDSRMEVEFDVSHIAFTVGQYYKVQLAFISSTGLTGYFSTVGVVKYTTEPKVEISGLIPGAINNHIYYYTGVYSQEGGDTSEKLYSSRFVLYNANNEIIKDSGEILHNIANDSNAYEAHEDFEISIDLEINASYYLQYSIKTTSGYVASTKKYRIMQKKSIAPDLRATLSAILSFEDGYIDLYLVGEKDSSGTEQVAIGSFVVCRAASNENYVWNKVCEFSLQSQTPSRFLWRDYTIEQGVTYKYSVQQYNDYGLYSDRIMSESITADFEDAFLYDGKRQLKIRYNPKVSSFKTDILEQKTDTIGSKHPFIFRNGNVYYKEFPISGLISYQMDDNHLFMTWDELGIEANSFNFTSDNILAERLFKLEVLKWLNNGEEKLFRSPTEGNYIVRLMNVSLSPTDSLGRMLHTFNCTAYEIEDFTYEALNGRGFIEIANASTMQTRWSTVEIAGHSESLDKVLSNVRRYLNAGIIVSVTEEQYNRILSYDYSLKDYFGQQNTVAAYIISPTATASQLNKIATILNKTVNENKTFTSSDYAKLTAYDTELAELLIEKVISTTYVLSSTVVNNSAVLKILEDIVGKITYATGRINTRDANSIYITDMLPGTMIELHTKHPGRLDDVETIQIGATGSYNAHFEKPITSIVVPQTIIDNKIYVYGLQGSITYSYESTATNVFDTIQNLEITDVPNKQWIGLQEKTYYDRVKDQTIVTNNLIEIIENNKTDLVNIYSLRFEKRELVNIYANFLTKVDGTESDGIKLDKLPHGCRLVPADSKEAKYAINPNQQYSIYQKTISLENPDNPEEPIVLKEDWYRLKTKFSDGEIPYVKVYDYYIDRDCKNKLDLDSLDPYYVYNICNARFDYTYKEVWYEDDFIDSNLRDDQYYIPMGKITEEQFNSGLYQYYTRGEKVKTDNSKYENRYHYNIAEKYNALLNYYVLASGYYVDKDGVKYPLESGYLIDGLSTDKERIMYIANTFSNKIYINGEEMDLSETGRYSIVNFEDPITSIKFDNGIICDMSYQIREITYNFETNDETVASYKARYTAFVNRLNALRALESLEQDFIISVEGLDPDSKEYIALAEANRLNKIYYASVLQNSEDEKGAYVNDWNNGNYDYKVLEAKYLKMIKITYNDFIYQLELALKTYEEANSVL